MPCVLALLLGLFFSAPPAEDVNKAAQRVLDDSDYQTVLPGAETGAETRKKPPPRKPERRRRTSSDLQFALIGRVLMYVLMGASIIVFVFWLVYRLQGYDKDVAPGGLALSGPAEAQADPEAVLGDAEALAAKGRFTEAIHTLLLRALQLLSRKETVAGSLTSREILREVEIGADVKDAVGSLVAAVEISLFGGRALGEGDYRTSLDAYRRFAAAYGRAGGAA